MKRIFITLISFLLISGAAGCDSLPGIQLAVDQGGASATPEVTQTPVDTPTFWPTTTFQFPPTWTPVWIKPVTSTPVPVQKSLTPSADQTPASKIITPLYPTGLFTIQGSTSQKTSTIPFKASTITLVWKYTGTQTEQDDRVQAGKMHKDRLNTLNTSLNQTLDKLNGYLADATNQNNASQISYWNDKIKQTKADFQQQIDEENIRYQTQVGKITTAFSIKINRISVNKPVTLVTAKGLYIGQVPYKTVSAADYYFIIEASGAFQIDITR